jgi:hypothetical protein
MSLAKLKRINQLRSKAPLANLRRSEDNKEYEAYLKTLSDEELKTLYENDLEEYRKLPEGIALDKKYAAMTVEELTQEYFQKLKAS